MSEALKKPVAGPSSKLRVFSIGKYAFQKKLETEKSYDPPEGRARSKLAVHFNSRMYSSVTSTKSFKQPACTSDPGQLGELPRFLGGYNLPTLVSWHEPAAAGAMVGITASDLLAKCKLLAVEARGPSTMAQEHLG